MTLKRAVPVLASLDIDATARFYQEQLGFETLATYDGYAVLARDGVQIHMALTQDAGLPKQTSCRIDVDAADVEALYAEMDAAGVVHPNAPLRDQPWGMREFGVLDGDGNLITFQALAPTADAAGA